MSQEDVGVAREAWDALNRDGVDGLLPFLDPDIEWVSIRGFLPDAEDRHGHDGVRSWFAQIDDLFEETHWEVEECVEGDDRLLVVSKASGRGRVSGVIAEITLFHAVTFREGKIARFESYVEREQALQAVGLRE